MNFLTRFRAQSRIRKVAFLASAAGAIAVVVLAAVVLNWPSARVDSQPAKPAAAPAVRTAPPETVHVAATFAQWTVAGAEDAGTRYSAEAGSSKDASVALRIDSMTPAGSPTYRSLHQTVAVLPSTRYNFSAWVQHSDAADDTNVSMTMGSSGTNAVTFAPKLGEWNQTTWDYTTGAEETELPLSLNVTGPTKAFRLDALTMTSAEIAENVIINGSFEEYTAPTQVTNETLILTSGEANVGVAWRTTAVDWSISDEKGSAVASGQQAMDQGLGMIPLKSLPQGFYSLGLSNRDDPTSRIDTTFMVLDPPAEGSPVLDERFGATVHFAQPYYANVESVAPKLGFGSVRADATWASVETTQGTYTYPPIYESAYAALAAEGVSVLPIADYTNKFYDDNQTPSSPAAIQAFANYTSAFVGHYSSPAVEIFNEFNNPGMNTSDCGMTASCYLPLLKASYEKVKGDHPGTSVVGPAIAHKDDTWLTELYAAGGLQYLDAVTFHPYDSPGAPEYLEGSLQQANSRIAEYSNGEKKPIWLTELGWTTSGVTEQEQSDYLVRAETISLANGVEKFYWYDLVNDHTDLTHHEGNFGLVRQGSDTVPAFAPKVSAMAQGVLIRKIAGKDFSERDQLGDSAYSYVFGTGDAATRVAWATTPMTVEYVTDEPVSLTTQYGAKSTLEPVNGRVSVALTGQPVYLDGALQAPPVTP